MVGLCEPPDAHSIPMSVWIALSYSPPYFAIASWGLFSSTTVIQNHVRTMLWYRRPSPGTIVQTLKLVIGTGISLDYEERLDMPSKYPIHIHQIRLHEPCCQLPSIPPWSIEDRQVRITPGVVRWFGDAWARSSTISYQRGIESYITYL